MTIKGQWPSRAKTIKDQWPSRAKTIKDQWPSRTNDHQEPSRANDHQGARTNDHWPSRGKDQWPSRAKTIKDQWPSRAKNHQGPRTSRLIRIQDLFSTFLQHFPAVCPTTFRAFFYIRKKRLRLVVIGVEMAMLIEGRATRWCWL